MARPLVRRSADELRSMRAAGRVVAEMHAAIRGAARPGVTTGELDRVARDVLARRGATSNFLGYHGFPAVICASVNDEVIHGIPGPAILDEGDVLSIDCGAIVDGWHGDAAFTMGIGAITPEAQRLIAAAERALAAGIAAMMPGQSRRRRRCGDPGRGRGGRLRLAARLLRARHRPGDARGSGRAEPRSARQGCRARCRAWCSRSSRC